MKDASHSSQTRVFGVGQPGKSLLRNIIRHTDTHNRLLEEAEMWQMHRKMKGIKSRGSDRSNSESEDESRRRVTKRKRRSKERGSVNAERGDLDIQQSFLYDDRTSMAGDRSFRRGAQRAHMDDVVTPGSTRGGTGGSTYWMRQLEKAEAQDPDRWGHAGFKELYPDDFDSEKSDESDGARKKNRGKHHRKRDRDSSLEKSRKRSSSSRKGRNSSKVKRKKRKRESSDTDSSSAERSSDEKKKSRKKKKKRKKLKKRIKIEEKGCVYSESDSEEGRVGARSKFMTERNDLMDGFSSESPYKKRKRK